MICTISKSSIPSYIIPNLLFLFFHWVMNDTLVLFELGSFSIGWWQWTQLLSCIKLQFTLCYSHFLEQIDVILYMFLFVTLYLLVFSINFNCVFGLASRSLVTEGALFFEVFFPDHHLWTIWLSRIALEIILCFDPLLLYFLDHIEKMIIECHWMWFDLILLHIWR